MTRRISAIILFFLLLASATAGLSGINSLTPVLSSGSMLPDDITERQSALSGAQWDEEKQGYRLTFSGTVNEDLVLTVADMDTVTILFWDEPVAS